MGSLKFAYVLINTEYVCEKYIPFAFIHIKLNQFFPQSLETGELFPVPSF